MIDPPAPTRRALLGGGLGAGAMLGARPSWGAPARIHGELTPQQFGATGGDPVADTRGWTLAAAESARTGRPVLARGTFVLTAPSAPDPSWRSWADEGCHIAVRLKSGTTIHGDGAEIVVAPSAGYRPSRLAKHFIFGIGGRNPASAAKDVSIEGLVFDFRQEFGPLHPFTYAVGAARVGNLVRRDLTIRSSGAKAGRGLLAEETRGRVDERLRHENIVQGTYTRYERNLTMRSIAFEGFNEALDFEGPCWNVTLDQLAFSHGEGEAQCIDTGGGADWLISNVSATDTGPIGYVYVKGNAWPTYREWLASEGRGTPHYAPPERMTFRRVTGVRAGGPERKGEALRLGVYRTPQWRERQPQGGRSPDEIVVEDWVLRDSGPIAISDCENLKMERVTITRARTSGDGAALVIREPHVRLGGLVSGAIKSVQVSHSKVALEITGGAGLRVDDIRVEKTSGDPSRQLLIGPRPGAQTLARLGSITVNDRRATATPIN